ncbi:patatin-like phospholipase family protein [Virgibacillus flavescens]|uniref:patatin-like phospholipase family protein n=1 Tax=Virgibacillus flavescens TaxID=1611422 RepID=UPI003D32D0C7
MKIDVVFSGGGVKSFAFLGVLRILHKNNFQIERVAGTSAGAIVAGLLAANYSLKDIEEIISEVDVKKFLDKPALSKLIPLSKWFYLYYKMGFYKGDYMEEWIYDQLAKKKIFTFSDIKPGYLKVVVSDLSLGKLVVIPDDLEQIYGLNPAHFPIAKAIRMSAGYPYLFMPSKISGKSPTESLVVDGGLLSNYPLWIFDQPNKQNLRPVLGVKLSGNTAFEDPKRIKNLLEMSFSMFTTMKQAHDLRYVSASHQKNTIYIPISHVDTTDFQIKVNDREHLIGLGEQSASEFLMKWP